MFERADRDPMVFRFGPYEADTSTQELRKHGIALKLPPQAFQVLALLLRRPGELLTREEIQQELWPTGTVVEFDHSINTAIKKIRAALSDSRETPTYLETLSRRGYRFIGTVDTAAREPIADQVKPAYGVVDEAPPLESISEHAVTDTSTAGALESTRPALKFKRWLLLTAGVAAVIAAVLWRDSRPKDMQMGVVTMTALTDGGDAWSAAVSPDGKYVAMLRRDSAGADHLWVEHLASHANNLIPLDNAHPIRDVTFSADSNFIYYRSGEDSGVTELYRIPVLGGIPALVTTGIDSPPTFSAGTQDFYFLRLSADEAAPVLVRAMAEGTVVGSISMGKDRSYASPSWSPDGTRVAVLENRPDSVQASISIVDPSSGGAGIVLGNGMESNLSPKNIIWMPDGRGLLVRFRDANTDRYGLGYVSYPSGRFSKITKDLNNYASISASASTGIVATLAPFEIALDVFPWRKTMADADGVPLGDADWVDWLSNDMIVASDGELTLRTISVSTKERKTLLPGNSLRAYDPSVCGPHAIAFTGVAADALGSSHIYVLPMAGGTPRKITAGPNDQFTRCTPDGRTVVYYSYSERSLRQVSTEGVSSTVLIDSAAAPQEVTSISADGRQVLAGLRAGAHPLRFALVDLSTGHIDGTIPASPGSFWPTFTRAGDKMVYVRRGRSVDNLWIQSLDGKDAVPLTDFHLKRCVSDRIVSYAISPDGKQVAVTRNRQRGDVVTLEAQGLRD